DRVRRVACKQDVVAVVVDADHRYVARRVAGCGYSDYAAVIAERTAVLECSERTIIERQGPELDTGRHGLPEHALHHTCTSGTRERQLAIVHQHRSADVNRTVHVVAVQVCE